MGCKATGLCPGSCRVCLRRWDSFDTPHPPFHEQTNTHTHTHPPRGLTFNDPDMSSCSLVDPFSVLTPTKYSSFISLRVPPEPHNSKRQEQIVLYIEIYIYIIQNLTNTHPKIALLLNVIILMIKSEQKWYFIVLLIYFII